jgi:hypothetical protein
VHKFWRIVAAGICFQGGSAAVDSATIIAGFVHALTGSSIAVGVTIALKYDLDIDKDRPGRHLLLPPATQNAPGNAIATHHLGHAGPWLGRLYYPEVAGVAV